METITHTQLEAIIDASQDPPPYTQTPDARYQRIIRWAGWIVESDCGPIMKERGNGQPIYSLDQADLIKERCRGGQDQPPRNALVESRDQRAARIQRGLDASAAFDAAVPLDNGQLAGDKRSFMQQMLDSFPDGEPAPAAEPTAIIGRMDRNDLGQLIALAFGDHKVRVVQGADGEPEFVVTDLAKALRYDTAGHMLENKRLVGGIGKADTLTPGGVQEVLTVREAGLYQLIATCKKPEAQPFKVWVFEVVLPSIRKSGSYVAPAAPPLPSLAQQVAREIALVKVQQSQQFELYQGVVSRQECQEVAIRDMKADVARIANQVARAAAVVEAAKPPYQPPVPQVMRTTPPLPKVPPKAEPVAIKATAKPKGLTATDIGVLLGGKSPQVVNRLLYEAGAHVPTEDRRWQPTLLGLEHSKRGVKAGPTGKEIVYYVWQPSVLVLLGVQLRAA